MDDAPFADELDFFGRDLLAGAPSVGEDNPTIGLAERPNRLRLHAYYQPLWLRYQRWITQDRRQRVALKVSGQKRRRDRQPIR